MLNHSALYPGDIAGLRWPSLRLPAYRASPSAALVTRSFDTVQRKASYDLRRRYDHILAAFAHKRIDRGVFAMATGSFSFLEPVALLAILQLLEPQPRELRLADLTIVDIGGGGHTPDFLLPFLGAARYVAFDATPKSIRENQLTFTHTFEGYTMVNTIVTPPGLPALLAEHGVPKPRKRLAVLKVDIDSCDCDVLAAALAAGYRPSVIVIEINPVFPPPIRFNLAFKPNMHHNSNGPGTPIYSCSLSHAEGVAAAHGYALLQAPIEDAYFVPRESLHLFGKVLPRDSALIFAMGNPLYYAYRNFGPNVTEEWAGWLKEGRGTRAELLSAVQANVTRKLRASRSMHLAEQVQLSLDDGR